MSHDDHHAVGVPRPALIGAAALIALTIVASAVGRITGVGTLASPSAALVESVELRFEDRADGAVVVRAGAGATVTVLEPGSHGFVRGVLRGLARERRMSRIGPDEPFRLNRWADGRLSLDDPATGRHIDLGAFGPDNIAAFVRLMQPPTTVATATH